jgi:hypothetical protein
LVKRSRFSRIRLGSQALTVAGLVCIWALLYLPHLRTSPGWYGDEFVTLIAGNAVLDGTFENRALRYSFFSVFTNYQPVGVAVFALGARLFSGGDILGARLVSALLALALALVVCVRLARQGRVVAGLGAGLLALAAPQSLVHFRWVYPHHFVALAVAFIFVLLVSRRKAGDARDWWVGGACALAAMTHLLAVHVTAAALLAHIRRPSAWLRIGVLPGLVFLAALGGGYAISGDQLFADLRELAGYYAADSGRGGVGQKLENIGAFFTHDGLHLGYLFGLAGLLLARRFAAATFLGVISLAVIQNRQELRVFYYQAMIFAPTLGVALVLAVDRVARRGRRVLPRGPVGRFLSRAVVLGACAAVLPSAFLGSVSGRIVSRNAPWVAPSHADLEASARWVQERVDPRDFVVAFWDVGWRLDCRWTDMLQCAVWEYGVCPAFYVRPRGREEFLFPADVREARMILVGPLDVQWAFGQGTVPRLLREAGIDSWKLVPVTPTTAVLLNPRFPEPAIQ